MNEHALAAARGELRRVLAGRVVADARARPYAHDFGRQVLRTPGLVVAVSDESEIAAVLEVASRFRLPCRVRGAGHSCGGQALVAGGIVLLNAARRPRPVRLHDDDALETATGNRWSWAERSARRRGRAVPVLGDWPTLTVGGTLAVGGYGVASLRSGSQLDHVTRIRLVLANGRALWCSPQENPDLFRYSLAGLGTLGVIERAVVRTVPHAPWLSLRTYHAPDLAAVRDAAREMTGWPGPWPDVFYYTGKRDRIVVGQAADGIAAARRLPASPLFARMRETSHIVLPNRPALAQLGVAAWLARFPNHTRIWSDYLVPAQALPEFLAFVDEVRGQPRFDRHLRTVYVLGVRTPARAAPLPLSPTGEPAPALAFGVGLYSMIPARDTQDAAAVRAALRACLEKCVALGGRPYLYGWHEPDADLLARAYGSALGELRQLRCEHDPHGLFPAFGEVA